MIMTMTMLTQLRMMYIWLLNDGASMDAKFDDFAKRDGLTDHLMDGQTEASAYWDAMEASKKIIYVQKCMCVSFCVCLSPAQAVKTPLDARFCAKYVIGSAHGILAPIE